MYCPLSDLKLLKWQKSRNCWFPTGSMNILTYSLRSLSVTFELHPFWHSYRLCQDQFLQLSHYHMGTHMYHYKDTSQQRGLTKTWNPFCYRQIRWVRPSQGTCGRCPWRLTHARCSLPHVLNRSHLYRNHTRTLRTILCLDRDGVSWQDTPHLLDRPSSLHNTSPLPWGGAIPTFRVAVWISRSLPCQYV